MGDNTLTARNSVVLPKKDLAGSKLRCLMLTSLADVQVAATLTSLISPLARVDAGKHSWMPRGFVDPVEAKLHNIDALIPAGLGKKLSSWWLVKRRGANTPNWDIASTCTVAGRDGLLLVEAKAHDKEAGREGKRRGNPPSPNHEQIGKAIREANQGLNAICPGWSISRDSHYQLSNRFAWAWKIASLGIPVVLIYLGFLNAEEMRHCGQPFGSARDWERFVRDHTQGLVPQDVWGKRLQTSGAPMWPMIGTLDLRWLP